VVDANLLRLGCKQSHLPTDLLSCEGENHMSFQWQNAGSIEPHQFTCGYCDSLVASSRGWSGVNNRNGDTSTIYICPFCAAPTAFVVNVGQIPGVSFGYVVDDIPDPLVEELYEEARRATSANCYTATILCCRKLLMHIAVSLGASEGNNFLEYVNYLNDNHYTPPKSEKWVDHIRKMGNEANHEINIGEKEDAEELLTFIEMLLRFNFDFHAKMNKRHQPRAQPTK